MMRSTMTRLKPCTMGHSRTALDPDVEHQQIICRASTRSIRTLWLLSLTASAIAIGAARVISVRIWLSFVASIGFISYNARRLVLLSMETLLGPLSFTLDHSKKSDGDEVGWQTRPSP
jgi:hypothetical protein